MVDFSDNVTWCGMINWMGSRTARMKQAKVEAQQEVEAFTAKMKSEMETSGAQVCPPAAAPCTGAVTLVQLVPQVGWMSRLLSIVIVGWVPPH